MRQIRPIVTSRDLTIEAFVRISGFTSYYLLSSQQARHILPQKRAYLVYSARIGLLEKVHLFLKTLLLSMYLSNAFNRVDNNSRTKICWKKNSFFINNKKFTHIFTSHCILLAFSIAIIYRLNITISLWLFEKKLDKSTCLRQLLLADLGQNFCAIYSVKFTCGAIVFSDNSGTLNNIGGHWNISYLTLSRFGAVWVVVIKQLAI